MQSIHVLPNHILRCFKRKRIDLRTRDIISALPSLSNQKQIAEAELTDSAFEAFSKNQCRHIPVYQVFPLTAPKLSRYHGQAKKARPFP